MASSSIDSLNVIYRQHTLILHVCFLQIYVHSSPYTSLITMLMRRRFVRCNFIGHHRWNGRKSSNQLRSFCRHVNFHMTSCLSVLIQTGWRPMRLCAIYWLIFLCSWPEMGTQCLPHGVSTLRSLVEISCQLVSQVIVRSSALQEFT